MQMKIFMKDNGMKVSEMVTEFSPKEMETTLKVIGLKISVKVKVHIFITIKINFLLENG